MSYRDKYRHHTTMQFSFMQRIQNFDIFTAEFGYNLLFCVFIWKRLNTLLQPSQVYFTGTNTYRNDRHVEKKS